MMLPDRIADSVLHRAKHEPQVIIFIRQAVTPAQNSERRTGVPASVTIAQGIIESASGTHHGGSANNYFGIKAPIVKGKNSIGPVATGSKEVMTTEVIDGVTKKMPDYFRTYKDMSDSFEDHGRWLKINSNYRNAITNYAKTGDADQFAIDIALAGYATAPNYAVAIVAVMKKHNLYQYNIKKPAPVAR